MQLWLHCAAFSQVKSCCLIITSQLKKLNCFYSLPLFSDATMPAACSLLPGILLMPAIHFKQPKCVCLSPVREAGVSSLGYCAEVEKEKLVLYSELGNQQSVHVMAR